MKYDMRTYVDQFPKKIQEGIRNAVIRNLRKDEVPEREIKKALPRAMTSRIGDLDEIINVKYWLNKANKR